VASYDAIVVGAGPAGSTAAFRLATLGASVLLLDRARFPRDKPCGGGTRVTAVRQGEVDADGETHTAGVVIGADGANGVTARSLALPTGREHGVALEGNLPYGSIGRERFEGRLMLEFGTVPGGYGWVFPKGDHLNLGVGGFESEGPRLREHLATLCEAHGVDPAALTEVRGHRLPLRHAGSALAAGKVALVGDAAGLVDPLSGDGMYEAFLSSKHVSEHALAILAGERDSFDAYAAGLEARLAPLVRASWGAKRAFDRYPRLTFAVAREPHVWELVVRLMRGDVAAPRDARGPVRVPLGLLRRIARAAAT